MKFMMVAIKDRSVEAYTSIQAVRAPGQAIRQFMDAINNTESGPMAQHPDDFDLYNVGEFNDETGELTPCTPVKLADGKTIAMNKE